MTPTETPVPPYLTARLSILIFLGFAVMGAWFPLFSRHATNLGFSAQEIAWGSATHALTSLIAPILWGQIADRWLPTQWCISMCALVSAAGLAILAELTQARSVILMMFAVWMFLIPTLGLITAITFRLLTHPERDYGRVRVWGTIGWASAGWCLTAWWWVRGTHADFADSMRLGALAALVLSAYALTLPHTPPRPASIALGRERSWAWMLIDAPLSALALFRDRSFSVYIACMFAGHLTMPFTMQLNPLLLGRVGVAAAELPRYMTIAQSIEIVMLPILPLLLMRFGMKTTMLVGGVVWTYGLTALAIGTPSALVYAALASHGIFIVGFFVAGQVFVNRQASHDIRASAQALLLLVIGLGQLLGHLLVAWIRNASDDNFQLAYLVAAGIAVALVVALLTGFRTAPSEPEISVQPPLVPESEMA